MEGVVSPSSHRYDANPGSAVNVTDWPRQMGLWLAAAPSGGATAQLTMNPADCTQSAWVSVLQRASTLYEVCDGQTAGTTRSVGDGPQSCTSAPVESRKRNSSRPPVHGSADDGVASRTTGAPLHEETL